MSNKILNVKTILTLYLWYFSVVLTFFACRNPIEVDDKTQEEAEIIKVPDKDTLISVLSTPLIITDLDMIEGLDWTSGFVNKDASYCDFSEDGQYGCYYLIDKLEADKGSNFSEVRVGEIVVYRKRGNDWTVNDTTQFIQSVILRSNLISVWDSVHVGMKKDKLLDFIGAHKIVEKDSLLHVDFNSYYCEFTFLEDVLSKIYILKKCD